MDLIKPAGEYTRPEMLALLAEGAKYDGGTPYQAAVHLLTFTELPGLPMFARYVLVDDRWSMTYQASMRMAYVPSWGAILRSKNLGVTDRIMLTLAASFASGTKVCLDETLSSGLGWAHVRRIAEAVFIRCGMSAYLTVAGTGELDNLKTMYRELSGDGA